MGKLIGFWAEKNINKPGKKLEFDVWSGQNYLVNSAIINYIDPVEMTIHCDDNIVFRVHQKSDLEGIIKQVVK